MSCKFCGKVKTAIRRWLGVDEIIKIQGGHLQRQLDLSLAQRCEMAEEFQRSKDELTEAIALTATVSAERLDMLDVRHKEQNERMTVLRELIRENRMAGRKVEDSIREINGEVGTLTESVHRLEFPGFKPIEYEVPEGEVGG